MYDNTVDVPRLLRWYGGDEPLPHPVLTEARQRLTEHYAPELREPFKTARLVGPREVSSSAPLASPDQPAR